MKRRLLLGVGGECRRYENRNGRQAAAGGCRHRRLRVVCPRIVWQRIGAGADFFSAHWHGPPCEPSLPLQQHDPLAPQQLPCCAEDAATAPPQDAVAEFRWCSAGILRPVRPRRAERTSPRGV